MLYLATGSEFYKLFKDTLDFINVYNVFILHVNHLKNKRDCGIKNQENEKVFDDYRKLTNLLPMGLTFSDTTDRLF